jgi:bifunctional DNA-binding transcriptional regulator/antitoxin component of YhaV-PrlF toxin-antitoxin module
MTAGDRLTKLVRPLRSGQITIPAEFRRRLGIGDDTMLQMTLTQGELRITPVRVDAAGSPWFRELYDLFAPVRQEAIDKGYTEEEINAWIAEAVAAARAERRAKQP